MKLHVLKAVTTSLHGYLPFVLSKTVSDNGKTQEGVGGGESHTKLMTHENGILKKGLFIQLQWKEVTRNSKLVPFH